MALSKCFGYDRLLRRPVERYVCVRVGLCSLDFGPIRLLGSLGERGWAMVTCCPVGSGCQGGERREDEGPVLADDLEVINEIYVLRRPKRSKTHTTHTQLDIT